MTILIETLMGIFMIVGGGVIGGIIIILAELILKKQLKEKEI